MHVFLHLSDSPKRRLRSARAALRLLAAVILAIAPGCSTLYPDTFTVEPSALDYLQIVRVEQSQDGLPPKRTRLDLGSSGHLELTFGRSSRVRSGFWEEPDSENWNDWQRDALVLPPEKTLACFQAFVDTGILRRTRDTNQPQEPDFAILIAVGKRKNLKLTSDGIYHKLFNQLLAEFGHSQP